MSTKTQTNQTSSNQLNYDPSSLQNYQSLTGSGTSSLLGYMNSPFNNAAYNMGIGASQKGAAQMGNQSMQSLMQNMKTSGISGNSGQGFQMAQMGKIGRSNLSIMGQANTANVQSALQRQMQATGMGMSYSPLLKGTSGNSQSTQTQGGLGTWLPQLLGAGLGAAMGGFGGGAAAGGGANATMAATQSMPSSQWGGASGFPGFSGISQFAQGPSASAPPLQWGMQ